MNIKTSEELIKIFINSSARRKLIHFLFCSPLLLQHIKIYY